MAKQGIITDCQICPMSIYHIHTLQTGGLWATATAYQIQ